MSKDVVGSKYVVAEASKSNQRNVPESQPSINATGHGTYDKSGEKSQTSATVSEKDADDGREEPLHQVVPYEYRCYLRDIQHHARN